MIKEELENNVRQIRGELDREREERIYFQLERVSCIENDVELLQCSHNKQLSPL